MKKISTFAIVALSLLMGFTVQAQVGINTTTPDASSALDIVSDSKGVLVPRLTLVQRGNITAPANGLLIYQTDNTPGFYYYNSSAWQPLSGGASGNFVDLTTNQTVGGRKTFSSDIKVNGVTIGKGSIGANNLAPATNTAFGADALSANAEGYANTAAGYQALISNMQGFSNTASGALTLFSNEQGTENTATGAFALYSNTSGSVNTAVGAYALYENSNGGGNTAVGHYALSRNYASELNTAMGYLADVSTNGISNATAIGALALVDASNKVQIGDSNVTAVKLGGTAAVLETSQIKLTGGAPGPNKVLTSDASGLATWQTPATGASTSRKRSVILDVASLDATAALSALPGTKKMIGGWQRPVLSLPDGSITQFQTQIPIPADWNGTSSFNMTVLYSSPTTSANFSASFSYVTTRIDASTVVPIPLIATVAPESLNANGLMEISYNIPAKATDKLLFIWFRRGQNASADTSTSEMHIHGVRIDYFD